MPFLVLFLLYPIGSGMESLPEKLIEMRKILISGKKQRLKTSGKTFNKRQEMRTSNARKIFL
jgi:hypothetical protein